ncbi:protein-tyrosine-phosphatase MKP1 isoform X2 [Prunus yedoensis var. nudiflora]|uniref:Protein-tyrosine-phosphatase MKP1 isoform X2 n=1 Tax=Prunus yedoensis var. nudiflora TaxID=2094558 RepID=A0A314Z0I9_PRUYE|nr:protein-tyrosine-phosphatase MKP1 isoform X2 [Prunus yedoensis var. nudiflora]
MDNLEVKPTSTISSIAMLNQFKVKEVGALEEKVVDLGMDEGLKLLKASLETSTVLTNVFLDVREQGGRVFVHCCQGVSRSTSLVIAYLMWREGQSFDDAFQYVEAARGIADPNMGFACQLL